MFRLESPQKRSEKTSLHATMSIYINLLILSSYPAKQNSSSHMLFGVEGRDSLALKHQQLLLTTIFILQESQLGSQESKLSPAAKLGLSRLGSCGWDYWCRVRNIRTPTGKLDWERRGEVKTKDGTSA